MKELNDLPITSPEEAGQKATEAIKKYDVVVLTRDEVKGEKVYQLYGQNLNGSRVTN